MCILLQDHDVTSPTHTINNFRVYDQRLVINSNILNTNLTLELTLSVAIL